MTATNSTQLGGAFEHNIVYCNQQTGEHCLVATPPPAQPAPLPEPSSFAILGAGVLAVLMVSLRHRQKAQAIPSGRR